MSDSSPQSSDRLDQALAALPRRAASTGFTRRVMASLDGSATRPAARPAGAGGRRGWVLAAAAVLAIGVGLFLGTRPEPPLARAAAERESLRLEHDELLRELESLRSLARETRPVLYLGAGDDVDYVLDLSPLVESGAGASARPASLDGAGDEPPPSYY